MTLPPGPSAPAWAQTLALHRDPFGLLVRARARHGHVFTLTLLLKGPQVVVTEPEAIGAIVDGDPARTHAGQARRGILPMASERSVFGADGQTHAGARRRLAPLFADEALHAQRDRIAALTRAHVREWPRGRPVRLLELMRSVVADTFVRLFLSASDDARARALTRALRTALNTPGNPPVPLPGEGDGPAGAIGTAVFKVRARRLIGLVSEEADRRRAAGSAGTDAIGRILGDEPGLQGRAVADELLSTLMAAQEPPAIALTTLLDAAARDGGQLPEVDAFLRRRPAALASLRTLVEPMTVAGHDLPAGTNVMVPIKLVHDDGTAFMPFGGGARRCIAEPLARLYLHTIAPAVLDQVRLRPLRPRPERPVLRATVLPPHRSTPVIVSDR